MNLQELIAWLLPETILTLGLLAITTIDVIFSRFRRDWPHGIAVLAFVVYGAATAALLMGPYPSESAAPLAAGEILPDRLAFFFRWLLLGVGMLTAVLLFRSPELKGIPAFELHILIMGTVLGGMFMALSSGIILIYLSLEFVSILAYVLTALKVRDPRAAEGAIKYVIFGGVASAVLLFGLSYIYGLTGSLQLDSLHTFVQTNTDRGRGLVFIGSLVLVFAGLGYKVAVVPFHAWAPDVYQAVPTPITTFFTLAPKIAGFALILRVAAQLFGMNGIPEGRLLAALAGAIGVLTMTVGNLSALRQTNIKRLLAWSSIAHAGYIIAAMAAFTDAAFRSMAFYLFAYFLMNAGAFLALMVVASKKGEDAMEMDAFAGLSRRGFAGAFWALTMAIFLFSLTGLPPFVGFIGKYYLFAALLEKEHYWIALAGILNTVVSLYYYARILHAMYFLPSKQEDSADLFLSPHYAVLGLMLAAGTIGFGLFPDLVQFSLR